MNYPEFPEFNSKQLDRLSEFFANLSLLLVAGFIIPNILGNSLPNMVQLKGGVVLSPIALAMSLYIVRSKK